MIYPMGGTIDGVNGDHILLAPPFIIDEGHVAKITECLSKSIQSSIGLTQKKCKKRGGWL